MSILSEENPPLSLYELSHKATIHDVYNALELIEFRKYLNIEQQNLSEQNN